MTTYIRNTNLFRAFRISGVFWLVILSGSVAYAQSEHSFTQFGHNITIGPNEQVGELTCFGCSVRVSGQVSGDVTALGGSVVLESQAQVTGEVTSFGGNLRLDPGAKVAGSVTVFGGEIRRDPQAMVSGDVTSFGGRGWAPLLFLFPLMGLGFLIALVIWLVHRARRPALPARAT